MESKPQGIPVTFETRVEQGETSPAVKAQRRVQAEKVLVHYDRLQRIKEGASLGPATLHVHLANACNHSCPWCEPGPYRLAHLTNVPNTAALQLLDQAKDLDVRSILLTGGGEPTVNPVIADFVDKARDYGIGLSMNTNAGLLHKDTKYMEKFRDSVYLGCFSKGTVRVTLDAFDPDTHKLYHGADDAEQVMANIAWLAKSTPTNVGILVYDSPQAAFYRSRGGELYNQSIMVGFVAAQVSALAKMGVRMIQVRPVFGSSPEENAKIQRAWARWEVLLREVAGVLPPEHNILNVYSNHLDGVWTARCWSSCNMVHLQSTLGANGDAFVCCAMKIKYGQWYDPLTKQCNWKDLWLSEGRRELAEAIDVFEGKCARCSQSAYNDVLHNVDQFASDLL